MWPSTIATVAHYRHPSERSPAPVLKLDIELVDRLAIRIAELPACFPCRTHGPESAA